MKPIDTHAHLVTDIKYKDYDLKDVIKDGLDNLGCVFNIGTDYKTSKEIIELNKHYPNLIPVIGIHPSDTNNFKQKDIKDIESLLNNKVVAIGETGLDFYHKHNILKQKESFIAHIELAKKYNLPIIIHSRESHDDVYKIVSKYPEVKFLLHSWGGSIELTKKFLSMNNIWYSFSGVLTFKNAQEVRDIYKIIPINKVMFETDSPWLTPEPYRGKVNFSKYVIHVIEKAAELSNITYDEMVEQSNRNISKFFGGELWELKNH